MTATSRILVVDDEPIERDILSNYLASGGYQTLTADNGVQALSILQRESVDCIILDVQMPVMDGFQTIDRIKSQPALAQIPVIFLTSMDRDILRIRGLESGALHYLTKPFNKAVLLATIRSVMRSDARTEVPADLEGDLGEFGLTELLQSLEFGQKKARIELDDGKGEVYIDRSLIRWIRFGDFTGEEAFLRLLIFGRGRYRVTFGVDYEGNEGASDLSLMHTMMESTRIHDELSAQLATLPPPGTLISFAHGADDESLAPLFKHEVMTLRDAFSILEMPLDEAVRILVDIKAQGRMIEVTREDRI